MAKGQKKSNREIRKPKAKKPAPMAALTTLAPGAVRGLEHMKNR